MKNIVIDFDSTICQLETLDELAKNILADHENKDELVEKIEKITRMGMEGEISFSESLERRVSLLDIKKDKIHQTADKIKKHITLSFVKNIDFFRENKERVFVISGGFEDLIFSITDEAGIKRSHVLANRFIFEGDSFIGIDKDSLLSQDKGKVKQLRKMDFDDNVVMIGDGWSDYEPRKEGVAQSFITFTENIRRKKVIKVADFIAEDFDQVIEYIKN